MGLGPLICPQCLVYADLIKSNDGPGDWTCPCCGSGAVDYMWMFTDSEQAKVSSNTQFVNFVKGKE